MNGTRAIRIFASAVWLVMLAGACSGASQTTSPNPTARATKKPLVLAYRIENGGLELADIDGHNLLEVTSAKTSPASWSPDGKSIVFALYTDDEHSRLYSATTDGHMKLLLDHAENYGEVAWAPDGKHVVVHVQGANDYEADVGIVDLATGNLRRVTSGPGDDKSAQVSPDGKWIAFKREENNDSAIWVVGWDGRNLHRLVPNTMKAAHPSWGPDSETIVFNDGSGTVGVGHGKSHIFTIRRDGTQLHQLTSDTTSTDFHPSWSPDGKTIWFTRYVFSPSSMPFALCRMAPDGTNIEVLDIDPTSDLNDAVVAPSS